MARRFRCGVWLSCGVMLLNLGCGVMGSAICGIIDSAICGNIESAICGNINSAICGNIDSAICGVIVSEGRHYVKLMERHSEQKERTLVFNSHRLHSDTL